MTTLYSKHVECIKSALASLGDIAFKFSKANHWYQNEHHTGVHFENLRRGGGTPHPFVSCVTKIGSVRRGLSKCDLRLSASKTIICPKRTTIFRWIWTNGTLQASPHKLATLTTMFPTEEKNICGLRSFIGAFKVLARVIPNIRCHVPSCSAHLTALAPLLVSNLRTRYHGQINSP